MLFLPEGQEMEHQKNSLETQRERIQIDLMYAKSSAIQRHFCIMTINNARSVGAGIDMEF